MTVSDTEDPLRMMRYLREEFARIHEKLDRMMVGSPATAPMVTVTAVSSSDPILALTEVVRDVRIEIQTLGTHVETLGEQVEMLGERVDKLEKSK